MARQFADHGVFLPTQAIQLSPKLLIPAPIVTLSLSADLDGSQGRNRASGTVPQISAPTDLDAVPAWLARYTDPRTTFENYLHPLSVLFSLLGKRVIE